MSERQIEMWWKCTSCGQRNLGRHGTCQACNNPKDGSEEWLMPDGPAPTVTDPALLALAKAGANWRCAFCASDQRATDGRCAQCGAAQQEGASLDPAAAAEAARPAVWNFPRVFWRPLIGLWVVGVSFAGLLGWLFPEQRHVAGEATVAAVQWHRSVAIERTQRVPREGFAETRPVDALEVQSLGPRHHHDEQVPNGTHVEGYSVDVADGTSTQRYTVQEKCGETCRTSAQSCSEKCTSNKNGFATCKTTCSGGGQTCSPKYCSVTKTKQTPRTRSEKRTRVVADFKSVPRDAEYFSWKEWAWRHHRTVEASGTSLPPRWPDEMALAPPSPLGPGEQERPRGSESFSATFHSAEGEVLPYVVPTEVEFLRLAPGSTHELELSFGQVLAVDGVTPTPDLVPLRYRPQLWFPLVLLLMFPLVFAGRLWPFAPAWVTKALQGLKTRWPGLGRLRPLRHLRHLVGLMVLFVAHGVASHPLDFISTPSRGLTMLGAAANTVADPARWFTQRGQRTTWVVVSRPSWRGTCRTFGPADGGEVALASGDCSGEGLPPPLPPPGSGGERQERSVRDWFVSAVELPSGRSLERTSPRLLLPGFDGEGETRYSFEEPEYRLLLPSMGKLSPALWDDGDPSAPLTVKLGWPE